MTTPRILAFAGSARKDSYNAQLVRIAAEAARKAGAEVTLLDMSDYPLPIFDEDLEREGTPESATKLKQLFIEHDALLIASPEYNSSITPALKNAIDWASRSESRDEPMLAAYRRKVVALASASPGALGGLRGLVTVRSIFGNIGCHVLPDQVAIPKAHAAFAVDGTLEDARIQEKIDGLAGQLVEVTRRLSGS